MNTTAPATPEPITTPPMPSLVYDDTADELRTAVRRLTDRRSSPTQLIAFTANDSGYDAALWRTLACDMGLAALLIPEEFGGAGASAREVSVVMEELGRSLAPVPYLASAVFATSVLTASTGPVATDVLRRLVDGAVAAVTVPAIAAPGSSRATVTATRHSIEERVSLSGSVSGVLALDCADVLLVPAGLDDERVVVLVDSHAPGITVHTPVSADLTRPIFDVSLDGVLGDMILRGQDATDALAAAATVAAAALASEQVGVGDWALATAVEYLTVRHQFGRPIGSYQSLRHRAAQLWIDNQHSRAAAQYAAAAIAEKSADVDAAVAVAQSYCSATSLTAVEECLQIHGGIGFTWEHPGHLYLERAFTSSVTLGTTEDHHRTLANLVNFPAA